MAAQRQAWWALWLLLGSGLLLFGLALGLLGWFMLPRWAPDFTIRHSPWAGPALRAFHAESWIPSERLKQQQLALARFGDAPARPWPPIRRKTQRYYTPCVAPATRLLPPRRRPHWRNPRPATAL